MFCFKSSGCYLRTDPSGPANHISLALIGMGEDPSSGQMAKVKVTKWYGFQNCTALAFQRASKCVLMSRSGQACMRCKERTNAGVITFLQAETFWQMASCGSVCQKSTFFTSFRLLPSLLIGLFAFEVLFLACSMNSSHSYRTACWDPFHRSKW